MDVKNGKLNFQGSVTLDSWPYLVFVVLRWMEDDFKELLTSQLVSGEKTELEYEINGGVKRFIALHS